MKNLLIILLTSLGIGSCSKIPNSVKMYRPETQCGDPWQTHSKSRIRDYIKNEGVTIYRMKRYFEDSLFQSCNSCACRSGDLIILTTKQDDTTKLKELGFKFSL